MNDKQKTKTQLVNELAELRLKVAALEAADAQRQQTAEDLRDSETRFRTLSENSLSGIYIVEHGCLQYVNPAFANIFGYAPAELIGAPSLTVIHPADHALVTENIRRHMAGEIATIQYECRGLRKNGEINDLQVLGVRVDFGQRRVLIGNVLDITERKQAEAKLQESEERYKLMFEFAPIAINITRGTDIIYANPSYLTMFGLSSLDELKGLAPLDLFAPEWRPQILENIRRRAQGLPAPNCYEAKCLRRDGSRLPVLMYLTRAMFVDGLATVGFIVDITERKRAEEALIESQALLKTIVESTSDMIWSVDHEHFGLLTFNHSLRDYFFQSRGIRIEIGMRPEDLFPADDFIQRWRAFYQRALREGAYTTEYVVYARNRILQLSFNVLKRDEVVFGVSVFGKDITDRKQTEAELQRYREHLEDLVQERTGQLEQEIIERRYAEHALQEAKEAADAANRAKSTFLANMSHELRTPLNAILGFAQLLARDSTLSPVQREYLDTINRSGENLLKLINDVLDLSKIEAGRMTLNCTSFDLWQALVNIEEMIRVRAEQKGLAFSVERTPDVPRYISTDESKLRQVLLNLMGNAVKFTEHGKVELRIANCELQPEPTPGPSQEGKCEIRNLKFKISDTGPGIAPEDQTMIFEAFRQAARPHGNEGTGLGLTISRQFVRLMGGDIEVHSVVGRGSCFTFVIQAKLAEESSLLSLPAARNVLCLASQQSPVRILVAEDHVENRQFLSQLLRVVGFDVQEAINGQDVVAQAQHWLPHLILMDMRMPVMDGYEATKAIRKLEVENFQSHIAHRTSPIPIIAITANVFEEEHQRILAAGCDAVLRKPIRTIELFETIRRYVGVEYVYAEEDSTPAANRSSTAAPDALTPDALAQLPPDVLRQLAQAALQINTKAMEQVIEAIRVRNAPLAEALAALAKAFRYKEIWNAIPQDKEEPYA